MALQPALRGTLLVCMGLLLPPLPTLAQTANTTPTPTPAPTSVGIASPTWASLTKPQQTALQPLAKIWHSLSEGQRRKWLAVAKTYPELVQSEQEKMHSRMVDWANLPAKDRELARLNFAQSKTVNKTDRAAHWEAYPGAQPARAAKTGRSRQAQAGWRSGGGQAGAFRQIGSGAGHAPHARTGTRQCRVPAPSESQHLAAPGCSQTG